MIQLPSLKIAKQYKYKLKRPAALRTNYDLDDGTDGVEDGAQYCDNGSDRQKSSRPTNKLRNSKNASISRESNDHDMIIDDNCDGDDDENDDEYGL